MKLRSRLGAVLQKVAAVAAGWSMTLGGLEMLRGGGRRPAKSGRVVTVDTALELSIVVAVCLRIAFGVAQVPWKVFLERTDGRGRDVATAHPLYRLLHRKPNGWQTSFAFRVTLMLHLLLCGNFFCFVNRVRNRETGALEIVELLPFEPKDVDVEWVNKYALRYFVRGRDGLRREIPAADMWHIRGPSWNGWMGLEGVKLAREAIGLAMLAEENQVSLQKRGGRIPGVLGLEGVVRKEDYPDLADWVKEQGASGLDEQGILLIDRQGKFTPVNMTGVEAQTLETRKLQIEEICRAFGILPVMIGHPADMAARAAMEQIFIAHVVHTLDPWMVAIEQSADVSLLSDRELDAGYYTRFIRAGLMRGALKDQAEWAAKALGQGATGKNQWWATPNEIRDLYEWNPIDGGDEPPSPMLRPAAAPKETEDTA